MISKLLSNYRQIALVLFSSALLVSCDRLLTPDFNTEVTELRGGAYTLDKEHASLVWKIDHLGFSRYIGRFNEFDASLDFDPENVANSSLEVIIDTASLDVNNPSFEDDLRGSDWFNVENFPQAIYRTTSLVETVSADTFIFEGDLTLLGTTAPVQMTVTFNGGARNFLTRRYTLGFTATAEFNRSDFGLDNMVAFGVGDDIQLEVHVEFQAAD